MSKVTIPRQAKKIMSRSLINLMKKTDELLMNKIETRDEPTILLYDQLTGKKQINGQFSKFNVPGVNYECKIDCIAECVTTGKQNFFAIHYLTLDTPKTKNLLEEDLDCLYKAYISDDVKVVYAVSTVSIVTKERIAKLVETGDINPNIFNVKIEQFEQNFPMEY